ncbi:unnamed protein product, partial [Lymnaea stagnalis]
MSIKWEEYICLLQVECIEGYELDSIDALGLKRYFSRRMLLSHVELIDERLKTAPLEKHDAK